MIMLYEDIMTPIEMLSNSGRLPVPKSPSYEPNLLYSIILHSKDTPEYLALVEKEVKRMYKIFNWFEDIETSLIPQVSELLSDPIPVCQFHVIEVNIVLLIF